MAKGNPQGAAVQYKVHLKPTDVGQHVIRRLERPHMDKSGELRKLIELGYAAEQAGFILDGTVLRHAGRAWETQPDLGTALLVGDSSEEVGQTRRQSASSPHTESQQPSTSTSDLSSSLATAVPEPIKEQAVAGKGSLKGKLRGLSG